MSTAVSTPSSSLRRTTELCSSELSHLHDIGVSTSDNSSRSCAIFEDEEISSVEAEGSSSSDPNDEETSEKQFLTAALVTSIVELAGTNNTSQPLSIGIPETRRRSLRKRQLTKRRVYSTNQTLLSSKCASQPVASEILQDAVNFTNESSINPNSMVPNPLVKQDILSASKNFSNMSHLSGQSAENFESQYQADRDPGIDEVEYQGRGRFFSIDLDCKFLYYFLGDFHSHAHQTFHLASALDFAENIVDPLADKPCTIPAGPPGSRDEPLCTNNCVNNGRENNLGHATMRRDRGFSFDFFSFGINEDEPLPPVPTSCSPLLQNRPRGDSIIFDPTSFREGGIHEASALLHIKQEKSQVTNDVSGNVASSASSLMVPGSSFTSKFCPPSLSAMSSSNDVRYSTERIKRQKRSSERMRPHALERPEPSKSGSILGVADLLTAHLISQTVLDNTIVPQSNTVTSTTPLTCPSTPNKLSHTACPMELLNKEGRIGIYLPEERKARILKFYSKREKRIWRKRIKYDCRKKLADSRPRIKGRFVKRSDLGVLESRKFFSNRK